MSVQFHTGDCRQVLASLPDESVGEVRCAIFGLSGSMRLYAKTQKGAMPSSLRDLTRLRPDTVHLWNGTEWSAVEQWGHLPTARSVRVTLRSGERLRCHPGALWSTARGGVAASVLSVGDVITTTTIPESDDAARPSHLDDAQIGWFVGLYIAEGSISGDCIQIAGHQKEVERYLSLEQLALDYHGRASLYHLEGKTATINLYGCVLRGILESYVSGSGAKQKHLHPRCWQRSNEFLRGVLVGYLSGDGAWEEDNRRWRLGFTDNARLAQDIRTICARLGATLSLRRTNHAIGEKKYPGFRGEVRMASDVPQRIRPRGEVVAVCGDASQPFWALKLRSNRQFVSLASGVVVGDGDIAATPERINGPLFMSTETA